MVAGLADSDGFSFCSTDGRYLRHYAFRIRLDANDGSDTFKQNASFHAVTGSQDESVRLMSHNFPTRCIRHCFYQLWADEYSTPNTFIQDDSSFAPVGAWTVSAYPAFVAAAAAHATRSAAPGIRGR